jgi:hypothetical protein
MLSKSISQALLVGAMLGGFVGCGSSTPPPEPAPEKPSEPAASEPAPSEPSSEAKPASEKPETEDAASATEAKPEGRDITYTQTRGGMKIEVAGVRFVANVKPVKVAAGWGVEVEVEATSMDGKPHVLLSPKNGPLAFGGKVDRSGKAEQLSDKRDGDKEEVVHPKEPFNFGRTWPSKSDVKPLAAGDSLELQVGLWGLGDNSESRRQVRDFLTVKMAAGKKKPQPVIVPPDTAARF